MLSALKKRELKQQAHHLHAVILVGQHGFTPAVTLETDRALKAHELIKVKINAESKQRAEIATQLCAATEAELVQTIGNMAILYRPNPQKIKPVIKKKKSAFGVKKTIKKRFKAK